MGILSREELLQCLGISPEQVGDELAKFSEAAKVLSLDHPRLIDQHPMQWVGIYGGEVAASDTELDGLMTKLADTGIPPSQTIVRFIDRAEKTFIL